MDKIDMQRDRYLRCPGFKWSNNPALFRAEAMWVTGTLPLDVSKDGAKGTPGWSVPELHAPQPKNTWIHKWGLFVHEVADKVRKSRCHVDKDFGCKYGFFKNGDGGFCGLCDVSRGYVEMAAHVQRCAEMAARMGK